MNAHVTNFIEQNFRSRYQATTQASTWLAGQLDELKSKVESSEDARINYERANQIWTIDEKEDVTTQKLGDINKELTEAQADRINKEAVFQLAQAGNFDAIPAVRESPVIQDILKQQTTLSAQYTDALLSTDLSFQRWSGSRNRSRIWTRSLRARRPTSQTKSRRSTVAPGSANFCCSRRWISKRRNPSAMADKMVQYNILKREAEANKELYDGLLQKLKEAGLNAGLLSSNIRIVDPAMVPGAPSAPTEVAQYFSGDPGRAGRRGRARAAARVHGQHCQESGRRGEVDALAFPGRRSGFCRALMGIAAVVCRSC